MSASRFAPFGVGFARIDAELAWDFVLAHGRAVPFAYLVTPNVDHLGRVWRQPALRAAYDEAALRLLDSRVVAHLARLCGAAPPPVVTGADLLAAVMPRLEARAARVAVVGLDAEAVAALAARYRRLEFVHFEPPRGFEHDEAAFAEARDFVIAARADCTLLAVGSPRQELLAQAVRRSGKAVGIGLCVGAAPLFLAGALRRAPGMLRRAGLEWGWRLMQEPGRLARRYLIDGPPVLAALAREFRAAVLPPAVNCAIDLGGLKAREAQCTGRQAHDVVPLVARPAQRRIPGQSRGDEPARRRAAGGRR